MLLHLYDELCDICFYVFFLEFVVCVIVVCVALAFVYSLVVPTFQPLKSEAPCHLSGFLYSACGFDWRVTYLKDRTTANFPWFRGPFRDLLYSVCCFNLKQSEI